MGKKNLPIPKTMLGKISVAYFCFIWWIIVNKPVLGIFNSMVSKDHITWLLGMPINFFYIIATTAITVALTMIVLAKWDVGGDE